MSVGKRILLWWMAAMYILSGILHFTRTDFYLSMMPPVIPWHLALVYASGVIETALGIAVLVPRYRVRAAWGIIALLIAIFPANVYAVMIGIEGAGGWVRLPLQALLIAWAYAYTRDDVVDEA